MQEKMHLWKSLIPKSRVCHHRDAATTHTGVQLIADTAVVVDLMTNPITIVELAGVVLVVMDVRRLHRHVAHRSAADAMTIWAAVLIGTAMMVQWGHHHRVVAVWVAFVAARHHPTVVEVSSGHAEEVPLPASALTYA